VRIDVLDRGSGVAEEQITGIFEAFTRLGSTTRRDGLGIGLFVVRQMLGHRINVSSVAHQGSRFSIFATRAEEAAAYRRPSLPSFTFR
jgi:signal transduction histidine kinase